MQKSTSQGDSIRLRSTEEKCIADFGQQWTTYTDNAGYYGSQELFEQILKPLMSPNDFRGVRAAEIGAGTGRICAMMLEAGAAEVTAVEPSAAIDVLRENLAPYGARVRTENVKGESILPREYDIVLSIGVLHHIPNPLPTVRAACRAMRSGGRMLIWLYGKEGNRAYLAIVLPLRAFTKRMPHSVNVAISWLLDIPLRAYMYLAKHLCIPMHSYMNSYLAKLSPDKRRLVIYDQLNPAWAKYYTCEEAKALLREGGLSNIEIHHREGYSWTVIGTKP